MPMPEFMSGKVLLMFALFFSLQGLAHHKMQIIAKLASYVAYTDRGLAKSPTKIPFVVPSETESSANVGLTAASAANIIDTSSSALSDGVLASVLAAATHTADSTIRSSSKKPQPGKGSNNNVSTPSSHGRASYPPNPATPAPTTPTNSDTNAAAVASSKDSSSKSRRISTPARMNSGPLTPKSQQRTSSPSKKQSTPSTNRGLSPQRHVNKTTSSRRSQSMEPIESVKTTDDDDDLDLDESFAQLHLSSDAISQDALRIMEVKTSQ